MIVVITDPVRQELTKQITEMNRQACWRDDYTRYPTVRDIYGTDPEKDFKRLDNVLRLIYNPDTLRTFYRDLTFKLIEDKGCQGCIKLRALREAINT